MNSNPKCNSTELVRGQTVAASQLSRTDQNKRSTDELQAVSQEERYQIYALKKGDHGQAEIAKIMDRDRGTISRELHRNRGRKG